MGNLLETIQIRMAQATLAAFQASGLFGFAVKLLNLPAQATHLLSVLSGILSKIVGGDIVCALGRKHQRGQFHLMTFGEVLDVQGLAMLEFSLCSNQTIHPLIARLSGVVIHLAIVLQRTIIDLAQTLNMQHQLAFSVPTVHQHAPKEQLLVSDGVVEHVAYMIQFGLAVALRVINPIVDDPELLKLWVDVHARHHPNALDNVVGIPAILPLMVELAIQSQRADLEGVPEDDFEEERQLLLPNVVSVWTMRKPCVLPEI